MQHMDTLERLARYRVEDRLREAEHDAQLRLARRAIAARRPQGAPGALQRIRTAVAALVVGERRATTETARGRTPGCCVG